MTKKQMYMKLVVSSLIRRKARMIVALLAVAIGAPKISGFETFIINFQRLKRIKSFLWILNEL